MVKISFEFVNAFRLFFNNASIQGFQYMTKKRLNKFDKIFWLLINLITVISTGFYMTLLFSSYMETPTIITLETPHYPITKTGFPGIAICNLNKINKRKALDFSEHLQRHVNKSIDKILEDIKLLANLYDFDDRYQEKFVPFQMVLEKYDEGLMDDTITTTPSSTINQGFYDPVTLMKRLGTTCEELLVKCSWAGADRSCSELFTTRLTFEGFCCTFNYLRPSQFNTRYNKSNIKVMEEMEIKSAGWEHGLSVTVLNDPHEEYFYTELSTTGFGVHIFHPKDYPDKTSGGLNQVIVNQGYQGFIKLKADVIKATKEVQKLSRSKRHCIFEWEMTTMFGQYQQSDCFVQCKVKSMLSLCGCLSFVIPRDEKLGIRSCTLADVTCLNKYKRKWMTNFPKGTDVEELEVEIHDSMYCEQDCVPTCDSIIFSVESNMVAMHSKNATHHDDGDDDDPAVESRHSVIHVYFEDNYSMLYKQDVFLTWFEMLSGFGGVFALFIGVSLVNFAEIAFFLIYKLIRFQ